MAFSMFRSNAASLMYYFILIILCGSLAVAAFPQSSRQQSGKLELHKLAEIAAEDIKDAAIYAEPLDQGLLRPKILVKKKAIEFLTQEGTIRNRIDFAHEFYTTFSVNEKYMAAIQTTKVPQDKAEKGASDFKLLTDDGALLWQESYSVGWDVSGPIYRISSNGIVCKTTTSMGTISFHDQQGTKIAEHVLWPSFMRTGLEGEWSQDGRYYAVVSPHLRERIGNELRYADKLTLFDAKGVKLWEQILQDKSANNLLISPLSKWALVAHSDMVSRNFGTTLYSITNGEPVTTIADIGLADMSFTQDDEMLLAKTGSKQNPDLVLYESISGKAVFRVAMTQRILALKLLAEDNLIYVLQGERVVPQNIKRQQAMERRRGTEIIREPPKTERATLERSTPDGPRLINTQLLALNLNGTLLGSTELSGVEAPPNSLMIHPASTAKRLVIKAGNKIILYSLDF